MINEREWMNNMENIFFSTNIIATIFYISVGLISMVMYNNSNTNYNDKTKKIRSLKSFMYLYKFLQISTLIVCISSIWSNNIYLYKIYENSDIFVYIGISISGIGITLFSIARFSLGKNYSPCYDSYLPKNINTKGIYSLVRHPIYTSNLLLMVGIFITSASAIICFNTIILFCYYLASANIEEKAIIKKFPKYKKYKNNTGMFIPNFIRI